MEDKILIAVLASDGAGGGNVVYSYAGSGAGGGQGGVVTQ